MVVVIKSMTGAVYGLLTSPLVGYALRLLATLWVIVEVCFYVYLRYIVLPELNRLTTPPPDPKITPWDQFHRIVGTVADLRHKYEFGRFFSGWFAGAKLSDIYKGNVRDMLAWALFSKDLDDCSVREKACLEHVLTSVKMRFAVNAPEGYNPNVKAMRLTLEPVKYVHRPLLFYMFLTVVQVWGDFVLTSFGFMRHEINGIAYWYRSPKGVPSEERSMPLVFFHGISPGLNLYVLMLHYLSRKRKTVLVEVPHISMCLNFKASRLGDLVKTVEIICKRHRMPYFAVCGHSFGSLCAAWMVKHLKKEVRQLILLDPVCVLLGFPDVAYNFLYKKPRTIMEYILYYGGATEITIHHTLRRQFWWFESQLFLDECPCPVYFGLSGGDEIVPSAAVRDYIEYYREKHHLEEHYLRSRSSREEGIHSEHEMEPSSGSSCDDSERCGSGLDKKNCIGERIQYTYWEGSSHGECLFNPWKLDALDRNIRAQERFFVKPDLSRGLSMSEFGTSRTSQNMTSRSQDSSQGSSSTRSSHRGM